MEKKNIWNSIVIHIPEDMVARTSKGKITIKQSMTKSNNLAKVNKKPSVQIKTDKTILNPVIENVGDIEEVKPKKTRKPSTRSTIPKTKPVPKDNVEKVKELRGENDKLYDDLNKTKDMTEKRQIIEKIKKITEEINKLK